jgi:hypothetical protein
VSVRTSSVVATGMVALVAIGIATIFGGTIAAVVTPPVPAPEASGPATARPAAPAPGPLPATQPGSPQPQAQAKDGSSS